MMLEVLNHTADVVVDVVNVVAGAPNPGGGVAPPGSEKFLLLLRWVMWLCSGVCVVGVMIAGATMALAHRGHGGGGEHAARLGWVLAGCIVIGGSSALVGALI